MDMNMDIPATQGRLCMCVSPVLMRETTLLLQSKTAYTQVSLVMHSGPHTFLARPLSAIRTVNHHTDIVFVLKRQHITYLFSPASMPLL